MSLLQHSLADYRPSAADVATTVDAVLDAGVGRSRTLSTVLGEAEALFSH
jgi:hypothetical protein